MAGSMEEDRLQAVILADSFNDRFKPLTLRKPRCLLPICNAPLLDWTLESLSLSGVNEVFVVCRSHVEEIKAAIENSRFSEPSLGMTITPVVITQDAYSPGDALRDVYTHGVVSSPDFILLWGDLVSNIPLDELLRVHKERRKADKDALMTMILMESGADHRTRPRGETSLFVLNSGTSQCLHYESVRGYPPKTCARLPREILSSNLECDIRNDLIDCGVDICSSEVLSLFQDNFDYSDIRRDFVHGVLSSDLLGKNIYCHVLSDGYAARVKDTKSYAAISKDILQRWTFPLGPSDNYPSGSNVYSHQRGNIYLPRNTAGQSPINVHKDTLGPLTLIGPSTRIETSPRPSPSTLAPPAPSKTTTTPGLPATKSPLSPNRLTIPSIQTNPNPPKPLTTHITHSVVGARCTIGPSCTLRNAVLFDGVTLQARCQLTECIIGHNVTLDEDCVILPGAIIGDGVRLGKRARILSGTRVARRRDKGEAEDDDEWADMEKAQTAAHAAVLGQGSNAIIWLDKPVLPDSSDTEEESDDDAVDDIERRVNLRLLTLGDDALDLDLSDPGSITSESESESDSDDDSTFSADRSSSRASSLSSAKALSTTSSTLGTSSNPSHAGESEFAQEVRASLSRAFAEGHSTDNASVELKTLRMASNVPLRLVRDAVVSRIVERISIVPPGNDAASQAQDQRKEISNMISRWGDLIVKIGGADGRETVEILQAHCARSPRLALFGQILAALYQMDIVDEDDIRAWHAAPAARGNKADDASVLEGMKKCWAVGAKMIQQFDEQEDDSEEEEEEEEDDSDASDDDESD